MFQILFHRWRCFQLPGNQSRDSDAEQRDAFDDAATPLRRLWRYHPQQEASRGWPQSHFRFLHNIASDVNNRLGVAPPDVISTPSITNATVTVKFYTWTGLAAPSAAPPALTSLDSDSRGSVVRRRRDLMT